MRCAAGSCNMLAGFWLAYGPRLNAPRSSGCSRMAWCFVASCAAMAAREKSARMVAICEVRLRCHCSHGKPRGCAAQRMGCGPLRFDQTARDQVLHGGATMRRCHSLLLGSLRLRFCRMRLVRSWPGHLLMSSSRMKMLRLAFAASSLKRCFMEALRFAPAKMYSTRIVHAGAEEGSEDGEDHGDAVEGDVDGGHAVDEGVVALDAVTSGREPQGSERQTSGADADVLGRFVGR